MSTTFTIDLDVSRALAAQQKMIDKMEGIANAGGAIATGMRPVREEFERLATSTKEAGRALSTISSSTNLRSQTMDLQKINNLMEQLSYWSKIGFGNVDTSKLHGVLQEVVELNKHMRTTDEAINKIASQLRSLPRHKFDFSSVEDYRLKLSHLGQELAALKSFKASLDPIDYSNMKNSLNTAINDVKQQFRNYTGSKDPYGMIEAFDRTYAGIVEKTSGLSQKIKDSLNVTTSGSISHKDIAESMGFGDAATNHLIANMAKIDAENKRLGNVLKTSIVGDATPSNKMSSLIASATKQLESTLGPAVIRHGEIWKSMGFDVDRASEAMRAMPDKAFKVATSIDATAEAYKRETAALTEATRAQMSFYEGMVKLGNYKGETQVKQSASLPYAKTWSAAYIEPSVISGQINTLETRIAAAFQQIPVRAAESVSKTESIFSRLSSYINNIFSGRNSSTSDISAGIANIGNAAGATESKLSGLGLVIKRVFEYGMVYRFQNAILALPGALWDATTAVEKLKTSYEGMFGKGGENEFKYAMDSAQKYGKSIESVADSYKKFATTAEFVGLTQDQTKKAFESVNQAMVKSGNGSEQTKGAFLALEQMLNKGTVSAEEYRRQFAQYIPGAMKMGADSVGKTTAEFMKMMKTGELISLEFVPNLMDQLANFAVGWEKMASTIESNSERLKNGSTMLGYNLLTSLVSENDIKEAQTKIVNLVDFINKELQRIKPPEKEKGYLTKALGFMIDVNSTIANSAVGSAIGGAPLAAIKSGVDYLKGSETDTFAQEQYWAMWKDGVANAKAQLDELMKTPGDISPESAKNIRMVSEQMQIGIDLVHKLCDPNWTVNVAANVDTSQIKYAMGLIDKLYGASKFGKTEDAAKNVKSIEAEQDKMKKMMGDLDTKMDAPDISFRDKETLYAKKTKVQDDFAKSTIALTAAMGTYNDVLKAGSKIEDKSPFTTAPTNSGESKIKQIQDATKHYQDMKKESIRAYEADQSETGLKKITKAQLDENLKSWDESLAGRIAQIKKQGGGGGHKEESHAIAVDKLANSVDNLLTKEFALADQDPLGAAFAAVAEKANNLNSRVKQLALDGGVSIEKMTEDIAKYKEAAFGVAIDKELEKLFPWLKKDNEITSIWKMLTTEWKRTEAEFAKMGISGQEGVDMLLKMAEAAKQATKEAKLLAKANSADNFGDYYKNASELEAVKNAPGGSNEKAAIKEMGDFFIATSQQMRDSRIEMYKRIAEQAKASGMDSAKAEAFVRAKMEETEVARLEALQKYGTASEAFSARMAQNYEVYKSAETKSRESAVKMADSIKEATDSMASGIGQSIGDIIRNMGNGTATIEDMWKGMLGKMLDMFANFVEKLVTDQLKDAFSGIMGNFLGGDKGSEATNANISDNFVQSSFTTASFTGAVFSGTIGSGGAGTGTGTGTASSSTSSALEQATGGNSSGGWDSSQINKLGDAIGSKSGSTFTDTVTGGTDILSFDIGNTPDIGKDITKSLSKYGNVYDTASNTSTYSNWQAGSLLGSKTTGSTAAVSGNYLGGGMAAIGGIAQMANSTSTMGTIGGGMMTAGGVMMMIPSGVTQVIGGIMVAGGALLSAFGSDKKEEKKKVASGYNVGYASGHATSYGVDFYNTGVEYSGPSDPDVQKKIADAFKDTAENLQDFAEELGFAVDVLEGFEFPNMNVTSDQLDGYIRNGENQMAFKGLMEAGLRGAFDAVAEDGEVYVDEYERLATSLKAVKGSFEAYGYDMQTVAQITQEQIDNLRAKNTEVAEGTADAMKAMATSMGAGADTIAQITSETTHASAALSVTDEQLSNILEADYSSKLLDAVGGEDAFKSIMGNLTKNIFDTIDAYAENLEYYNEKAQTSIAKLGDATVTVDNFWTKFDEAIKEGLTVDEFEAWGKASDWVNSINSVNDAIEAWDVSMKKAGQSLEARNQSANGLDYQAELTQQLATAEWELYDARKANYDANIIAQIQETQALEMAATVRKHNEDYQNAIQDTQSRVYSITDDHSGQLAIAQAKNSKEYSDYEKTYTHAPGNDDTLFKALEQAYALEITKMIQDWADALTKATESLKTDIAARRASLNGLDAEAEALQKLASYKDELDQAYTDGVDSSIIADLQKLQIDEMSKYWADAINDLNKELGNVGDTIADRLEDITKRFTDYTNGQLTQAQTALSVAQQAASTYASASSSIESTMESLKSANEVSDPKKRYEDALTEFKEAYTKGMTGDTTALSESGSLATTLMSAAKDYYANGSQYQDLYSSVYSKLGQLDQISTGLGIGADYQAKLLESQVAILTEINNELSQTDPSQEKLTNMVDALGVVSDLLAGTRDVYITDDATAPASLSAVNTLTGQTVNIGNVSIDQLKALKTYSSANVDATGEVADATVTSNTYLRTQEGILLSGNATQDILRQFSAQNISVSQEIKNAVLGDSNVSRLYLANVQGNTLQMVTLLGQFLTITQEQRAAQDLLVKQAQVASAKSAAETLYNQAVSAVQNTQVGQLTSQLSTTGAGYGALTDLSVHYGGSSLTQLQKIQSGQLSSSEYIGWFLQNYGTGNGQVDWGNAIALMKQVGLLPSNVDSLMSQYQSAQQQYLNLKAQYGFASGGVVPGSSFTGDSIIAGLNSGERVLTAEQNEHFEELVMNSGSSSELIDEVRELRKENAKLREDMNGFLYTIASSNTKMAKLSDDASRRGQLIRTE